MSEKPLISVILPTRNRCSFLKRAVKSVLGQTLSCWEMFIVDDGSQDETEKWVKELSERDKRFKYLKTNGTNVARARNMGIQASKSRYIAFLDDDDLWHPEKLMEQIDILEKYSEVGLVFSDGQVIQEDRVIKESFLQKKDSIFSDWIRRYRIAAGPVSIGPLYEVVIRLNCIVLSTVILRKEYLDTIGNFKEKACGWEGYDLWLRFCHRYQSALLDHPLITYRITDQGYMGPMGIREYRTKAADALALEENLGLVKEIHLPAVRNRIAACSRLAGWFYFKMKELERAKTFFLMSLKYRWAQPKILLYLAASVVSNAFHFYFQSREGSGR